MKKILFTIFVAFASAFGLIALSTPAVYAQSTIPTSWDGTTSNTTVQGGINVAGGTETDKGDSIIQVIKNVINYVLGFLGLIALIFLLIGGFKIVTAGGNDKAHEEGVKVLKNAAIGIAFIGIAWFLVTFIFYVFSLVTK